MKSVRAPFLVISLCCVTLFGGCGSAGERIGVADTHAVEWIAALNHRYAKDTRSIVVHSQLPYALGDYERRLEEDADDMCLVHYVLKAPDTGISDRFTVRLRQSDAGEWELADVVEGWGDGRDP